MGDLYILLLIVFYILARQLSVFCHELGHAFFLLKFTERTEALVVIGDSEEESPIYENGRLKIYYKFFYNFWGTGGYCKSESEEKFTLDEYILNCSRRTFSFFNHRVDLLAFI